MTVVNLVVLACVLRMTAKKGHHLFEEKSALPPSPPPEKILATPMNVGVENSVKNSRLKAAFEGG